MKHETTGRVYVLGMGDYDDFLSTSERSGLRAAGFHETSARSIDDMMKERTFNFVKEWGFLKGRIIGMIEGNHHYQFSSGITSTQLMCQQLECKYLGVSSFIRLSFDCGSGEKRSLDIWAHHGTGGGGRPGSSVNSVENMMRIAEADIFLSGHDHRKWAVLTTRLTLSKGGSGEDLQTKDRKILLARTGSFQKGYVPGQANYVSSGGMAPSDLGTVKIELTYKRKTHSEYELGRRIKKEDSYIDIHASI